MRGSTYSHILDDLKHASNESFNLPNPMSDIVELSNQELDSFTLHKFWDFSTPNQKINEKPQTKNKPQKISHFKNYKNPSKTEKTQKNLIHLTKDNLKSMLKDIKIEVENETKPKNNLKYRDSLDKLIETNKKIEGKKLDDDKIVLTKEEMKEMFENYKEKIKENLKSKEERYMDSWISYYNSMKTYCDKYYELQNLLWFYYSYQPDNYRKIMDDYYLRNNNNVLKNMGLNEMLSMNQKKYKFDAIDKYIPVDLQEIDVTAPRFEGSFGAKNNMAPDFIDKK